MVNYRTKIYQFIYIHYWETTLNLTRIKLHLGKSSSNENREKILPIIPKINSLMISFKTGLNSSIMLSIFSLMILLVWSFSSSLFPNKLSNFITGCPSFNFSSFLLKLIYSLLLFVYLDPLIIIRASTLAEKNEKILMIYHSSNRKKIVFYVVFNWDWKIFEDFEY